MSDQNLLGNQIPVNQPPNQQNANGIDLNEEENNISRQRKYDKIRDCLKKSKKDLKVISFDDYNDYIQCSATVIDQKLNKKFTLKVYNMFNGVDGNCEFLKQQANHERRALKLLKHPHILQYVGHFIVDNYYFILMEYSGISLQEWITQHNRSYHPIHALRFSLQLLSALKYIHSQKQQLKFFSLHNIYVNEKSQLKVYKHGQVYKISERLLDQVSIEAQQMNSPYFIPPEMITQIVSSRFIKFTPEGDIWQLGIFMYYLAGATSLDTVMAGQGQFKNSIFHEPQTNDLIKSVLVKFSQNRLQLQQIEQKLQEIYDQSWVKYNVEGSLLNEAQYQQDQQHHRSINNLLILMERKPNSTEYACLLGDVYKKANKLEEAIEWYEYCLKLNQRNEMYSQKLAKAKSDYQIVQMENFSQESFQIIQKTNFYKNLVSEAVPQEINQVTRRSWSYRLNIGLILFIIYTITLLPDYFYGNSHDQDMLPQQECFGINASFSLCIYTYLDTILSSPIGQYQHFKNIQQLCQSDKARKTDTCLAALAAINYYVYRNKNDEQYQKSAQMWLDCIEVNQKNSFCRSALAKYYLSQQKAWLSKGSLDQCMKINSNDLDCIGGFAFYYLYLDQFDKARHYLNLCFQIDQNSKLCKYYEAILNEKKSDDIIIRLRIFDRFAKSYQ